MINIFSLEILYFGTVGLAIGIAGLMYTIKKQNNAEVKPN